MICPRCNGTGREWPDVDPNRLCTCINGQVPEGTQFCKNCSHSMNSHDGGYWEKGSKKCSEESSSGAFIYGCDNFEVRPL